MADPKLDNMPFLGASAPWLDDDEVTYTHVKRGVANYLRDRLLARIAVLNDASVNTDQLCTELRRQMAECAVDGNLMLASELSEATWSLLQHRDEDRTP
jgi:hypothetical protein